MHKYNIVQEKFILSCSKMILTIQNLFHSFMPSNTLVRHSEFLVAYLWFEYFSNVSGFHFKDK